MNSISACIRAGERADEVGNKHRRPFEQANDDKFAGNGAGDFRGERLDAHSDLRCSEENAHPAQGYRARSDDVVRPIFRRFAVTIEVICIGLRHIGRFPALRARRSVKLWWGFSGSPMPPRH